MKKNIVSIIVILALSFTFVTPLSGCSADNQTKEQPKTEQAASQKTVIISVKGIDKGDQKKTVISSKDTAMSVLKRYAKSNHMRVVITGTGAMAYVTQIEDKKATKNSGWMFSVNGKTPKVGAGSLKVKSGDKIEWYFTKF